MTAAAAASSICRARAKLLSARGDDRGTQPGTRKDGCCDTTVRFHRYPACASCSAAAGHRAWPTLNTASHHARVSGSIQGAVAMSPRMPHLRRAGRPCRLGRGPRGGDTRRIWRRGRRPVAAGRGSQLPPITISRSAAARCQAPAATRPVAAPCCGSTVLVIRSATRSAWRAALARRGVRGRSPVSKPGIGAAPATLPTIVESIMSRPLLPATWAVLPMLRRPRGTSLPFAKICCVRKSARSVRGRPAHRR